MVQPSDPSYWPENKQQTLGANQEVRFIEIFESFTNEEVTQLRILLRQLQRVQNIFESLKDTLRNPKGTMTLAASILRSGPKNTKTLYDWLKDAHVTVSQLNSCNSLSELYRNNPDFARHFKPLEEMILRLDGGVAGDSESAKA